MHTAWIAAPPYFKDDTVRIQTLIGEVVTLLQPLGAKLLRTDEPREYRLTTEGITALNEAIMEITFNAYVRDLPTADQTDAVIATVNVWAREGQRSEFGGHRFRNVTTPSVNGRALRWSVEIPPNAYEPAIQSLRERLATIPNVNIVKLVLGTETVG